MDEEKEVLYESFHRDMAATGRDASRCRKLSILRGFVKNILMEVIRDEDELLEALLSPESMMVWERAFTHKSENAERNYEFYETIGDAALSYAFLNIISDLFPGEATAKTLTLSKNHYMSFEFQSSLAREHGLDTMLIVGENVRKDRKMAEDVFESFFGAFARLIDSIEIDGERKYRGESYRYVYELLNFFLEDHEITLETRQDPYTTLKQRFDVLREKMDVEVPKIKTRYVIIPGKEDRVILQLIQNRRGIPDIWAEVSGKSDDIVELKREISRIGLAKMDEMGYTERSIEEAREEKGAMSRELRGLIDEFDRKRKRYNESLIDRHKAAIIGYRFETQRKRGEATTRLFLSWGMPGGRETESLATIGKGENRTDAEIDAIRSFLRDM